MGPRCHVLHRRLAAPSPPAHHQSIHRRRPAASGDMSCSSSWLALPEDTRDLRGRLPPDLAVPLPAGCGEPDCIERLGRRASTFRASVSRRWTALESSAPATVAGTEQSLAEVAATPGESTSHSSRDQGSASPVPMQIALVAPPWQPEGETSSEGADKADRGALPRPDGG
jgi:hypothetical protein